MRDWPIITPEEMRVARHRYREEEQAYNAAHRACPTCGSTNIGSTCIGYVVFDWSRHEDENEARCNACDWKGIVHELVAEKK